MASPSTSQTEEAAAKKAAEEAAAKKAAEEAAAKKAAEEAAKQAASSAAAKTQCRQEYTSCVQTCSTKYTPDTMSKEEWCKSYTGSPSCQSVETGAFVNSQTGARVVTSTQTYEQYLAEEKQMSETAQSQCRQQCTATRKACESKA